MCSKKELIQNMNNENFWLHAGIQKYNCELIMLSQKIISLLSDKRLRWNPKTVDPCIYIDNDINCINLICENKGCKKARLVFNSKKNNGISISAYTFENKKKKCYINITWDQCISIISDIIS